MLKELASEVQRLNTISQDLETCMKNVDKIVEKTTEAVEVAGRRAARQVTLETNTLSDLSESMSSLTQPIYTKIDSLRNDVEFHRTRTEGQIAAAISPLRGTVSLMQNELRKEKVANARRETTMNAAIDDVKDEICRTDDWVRRVHDRAIESQEEADSKIEKLIKWKKNHMRNHHRG